MKNTLLAIITVLALVAAGAGGTLAGFVDTEVSPDNYIQAGITDLLVNGLNDPDVPAKIWFDHTTPCKSIDFWADLYNWGKCQGGDVYMHFKDVESVEWGVKTHLGVDYVYDGVAPGNPNTLDPPPGYLVANPLRQSQGAGIASSEPELGAEEGNFMIGQTMILPGEPGVMGVDYASGIAAHLGIIVEVPYKGAVGTELGNPDTDDDGFVSAAERAAWATNGNRWEIIDDLAGKLADIECTKAKLGFLRTQEKTFVHIDVHLQQIEDPLWALGGRDYDQDGDIDADDEQLKWWPTNALQGDYAMWDMLFELTTDP